MAAVTQTIQNYLGGVSNQPDDKKLPGQVKEAINAYPDPTYGLQKRPGLKFLTELKDGLPTGGNPFDATDLDIGKWFYYNRDADERYIGCIVGKTASPYGQIHIWNSIETDGVAATTKELSGGSGYSTGSAVATTSAGSGTGLTVDVAQSGGTVSGVTIVDGGEGYAVDEVFTVTGGGGNATFKVASITDDVIKKCTVNYTGAAREYLTAETAEDYDLLTIRDTSIVTNKKKVITTVAGAAHTDGQVGTVRIHLVEYSASYTVIVHPSGGSAVTCTINTRAGDTASSNADVTGFLDATDILTALKDGSNTGGTYSGGTGGINGITNISCDIIGNTLEITASSGTFTLKAEGGKGGEALTAYQNEVNNVTELAGATKHNRVVKIKNTDIATGAYFTKFSANDGTSGSGNWEETLKPGESTGLTATTMPHELKNTAKNVFSFAAITWIDRLVGDDESNSDPSFVGKSIAQAFFYNNRLGFLTEDNVSMSKAAAFYDFYMTSAQTSTDADPIDISCSSTRPANLHAIIPSAGGLLLFSQDQQFIMFSADGNLKPTTALIRTLSNYKMDKDIDPVDVGTQINFISKTHTSAGFVRVFAMVPQGGGSSPNVVDIGRVVAEYIPVDVDSLAASTQNSFIAMTGKSLNKIYFYRTYNDGSKDLMQTWFNWQLPGNVHYMTTDSDTMYTIVKTGSGASARYNLCSATMTQTPEETIIVTSEGQQVNPHMDFYKAATAVSQYPLESVTVTAGGSGYSGTPTVTIAAPASGTQATATATVSGNAVTAITITNPGKGYDPVNPPAVTFSGGGGSNAAGTAVIYDGSYCQLPFSNLTSLEPVIVIAGNATSNFSGTTESGFTITPGRTTVNSVNYFKVPSKDLSAQAANVYVGYKYNYDITLPKIYYQKQPGDSDYTANLTIARCKFSVGQSSVVGFKLKRKGVQAATQSFTGDGSTTSFSPNFEVKDKSDVIVKKNGAIQTLTTDYTIADHATLTGKVTVTFGSAPSAAVTAANVTTAADSIEIYVDQWYTLQPTQESNYYLGDDVPIEVQNTFVVPIHQKPDNYTLRVFSDSPFPLALTSMAWEGQYSPRYYQRT